MANPQVRPHLHFYPKDAGTSFSEYWHRRHWHDDTDPAVITLMEVINGVHFFVYGPCLLGDCCAGMPHGWFIHSNSILAHTWPLHLVRSVDKTGWVVEEYTTIIILENEFFILFSTWDSSHFASGLPSAGYIFGMCKSLHLSSTQMTCIGSILQPDGGVVLWSCTLPIAGNRWCVLARGAHLFSFLIWLYFDDISGNQSKKWNKHFDFVFSGWPPTHALSERIQRPFPFHIQTRLTTRNDGPHIMEQLEYVLLSCSSDNKLAYSYLRTAWDGGIWAWDYVLQACVPMIPFVAVLLDDNPMQSEFACHISQAGKFFCRICDVKSFDAPPPGRSQLLVDPSTLSNHAHGGHSTGNASGISDGDSSGNNSQSVACGQKKADESMQDNHWHQGHLLEVYLKHMYLSYKEKVRRAKRLLPWIISGQHCQQIS